MRKTWLLAACLITAFVHTASAAEVRIAVRTDLSSVDPHYHVYVPNRSASRHIFDSLTRLGPRGEVRPGLAASWKILADDLWEFTLRPGIAFHDGTLALHECDAFRIIYLIMDSARDASPGIRDTKATLNNFRFGLMTLG